MKDKVLKYLAKGFWVFPIHSIEKGQCTCGVRDCSNAGKHPRLKKGLRGASNDPEQIAQWFSNDAPRSNVGIVTGEISGITVIDIDVADGKMGAVTWQELINEHGEPNTLMARTGSGGMHVVFKYNSALKTSSNTLGDGVDVRNDGGYIVAPPSLHKSGADYEWLNWHVDIKPLPAYLTKKKEARGRKKKDTVFTKKYTIEKVAEILEHVRAEDRGMWRNVGIILGRQFDRSDDAWALYNCWSEKEGGKKGTGHEARMEECFYKISQEESKKELTIATIIKAAVENGWSPTDEGEVPVDRFVYYAPGNCFYYRKTMSKWIGYAVDIAVPMQNFDGELIAASKWIQKKQLTTSMTRDPLIETDLIRGYDCCGGQIIESEGGAIFNTYRRPTIELGDASKAQPFVEHVYRVFNKEGDADQFLDYIAHRVQKTGHKPRFALVLAGQQGVGKDTALELCIPAIGVWNTASISVDSFKYAYNDYAASSLVRISEAAEAQDVSKWVFNEQVKVLIAGSPDYVNINPKYGEKFSVRMFCGVIITTNHLSGLYIPEDDRRYDVIEAASLEEMGFTDLDKRKAYFNELWEWAENGGKEHVAAFLHERDISDFSADTGQRITNAHAAVVAENLKSDDWLDDILAELNYPDCVRSDLIVSKAILLGEKEASVKRKFCVCMQRIGYLKVKNPECKRGRWSILGKKTNVYAKKGIVVDAKTVQTLPGEVF